VKPVAAAERLSALHAVTLIGLVLCAVWLPVLLMRHTGSLSIPHNDDWSYLRSAQALERTGEIQLYGWVSTGLVGQLVISWPFTALFGPSITVLNLTTALFASLALLFTFDLLRQFVSTARALWGTAVVAIFPAFALLATSYMTDVPAFMSLALCLCLGVRAVRNGSWRWLAAAVLVGFLAFTIRQQAVAAPLAVLSAAGLQALARTRERSVEAFSLRLILGLAAALVVACAAYLKWRQGLPTDESSRFALHLKDAAVDSARATVYLALALSPAAAVWAHRSIVRARAFWIVLALLVYSAIASMVASGAFGLLAGSGNYLSQYGAYRYWSAGRLIPDGAWWTASGVALISLAFIVSGLLAAARAHWTRPTSLHGDALRVCAGHPAAVVLGAFAVLYSGTLIAPALIGWPLFDRYLLPLLLPLLALLLVLGPPTGALQRALATVAAGVVAALAITVTTSSAAFDAASWKAGERLAVTYGNPRTIDAGFEWTGYHDRGLTRTKGLRDPLPPNTYAPWANMFPSSRECFLVLPARTDLPFLAYMSTVSYRSFVFTGRRELFLYRNTSCGAL
jgi:hypothetical protein